ncbi:MAG: radical SAM protein [Aigarchaeota archaeon]|nr:radical SAM protein [Candidatus Wolframiiraptor gerlachensis]
MSSGVMIPQAVIWIISGACNLSCIHCYASRFMDVEELKLEEKLRLIDELAECGVSYIGITGGEPLINPDLEPCLKRVHDYGIECSINTNVQCLNERTAEILGRYDVYLFISVDGSCREVHERIRGPGTWSRLMRGVEAVRRAGLSFSTVMTINSLNYLDAAGYVELAERLGADDACMIPVMPVGRAGREIAPSTGQLITALKLAESAAKSIGFWINVWCYVPGKLIIDPRYISIWADCRRGKVVDIDPAGSLLLCDILDIGLSNVRRGFRQAIGEYFQSREMNEVMNPRLREPCKSCSIRESCMGGCYARSYLIFKSFNGPDPYCPRANIDLHTKVIGQAQRN